MIMDGWRGSYGESNKDLVIQHGVKSKMGQQSDNR